MRKYNDMVGLCVLAWCLSGCEYVNDLPAVSRIVAKNVCDGIYISGYETSTVSQYVAGFAPPLKNSWAISVDPSAATVSVRNRWFTFLPPQTAELVTSDMKHGCRNRYRGINSYPPATLLPSSNPYEFVTQLNRFDGLQAYVESVANAGAPTHTTGLLVMYDQEVVGEYYRDGIMRNSPLKGFSMSKSFANLLVGRMVDKGLLNVNESMPIDQWQNDSRANITWEHSLHMSSGLAWHEAAIGKENHQTEMLYESTDPSLYALSKAAVATAGSQFNYSSGDFMNIATALVQKNSDWFDPGWNLDEHFSLEFTPDSRYPLLPEGVSLTLRGWAQLISLYANEGRLGDLQVLSPEWVRYSLTPSQSNGDYGAGIWLNRGQSLFPHLPVDTIAFIGAFDRYTVAIPSQKLIFVRIGYSEQPDAFSMQSFIEGAMRYLPPTSIADR